MSKPMLIELKDNRFIYRCSSCGKEWETMTRDQAFMSPRLMHTCPKGPKPHEDASQAAVRIVKEATENE
jgi:DNA-directed RNA polymerase subunit RPC12/RpoP